MKRKINDYGSKKLMILSLFTIIFIATFSTSFALYSYNNLGSENKITSGTVEILFTEPSNDTTLITALTSEEDILTSDEYMEFKVSANASGAINTNYYVYFTINSGNTIDKSKVKMNLTLNNDEVIKSKLVSDFTPFNLDTLEEDSNSDKYLLYQSSFDFADSGTLTDIYHLKIWLTEGNINYTENGTTHTATLEGEFSIKLNVYAVQDTTVPDTLPDSCFTATVDSTNKTATLTGYLCNNKEITIPSTINSYISNTYSVKENPTDEEIAACKQVFTDFDLSSYVNVCSGETVSGKTLEYFVTDKDLKDGYGAALKDTGIINVESNTITLDAPYTVNKLGRNLFRGRGLTKVIIPSTITTINNYALALNNLTSVIIPDSVASLGTDVFLSNNLKTVYISKNITSILDYAFYGNNLQSVNIPNKVASIGNYAFLGNNIKELNLGTGVKTIGTSAFFDNELTTLVIPDNVTSIGNYSFKLNKLLSLTLSKNITSIPYQAFYCNYLTELVIPNQITSVGENAFSYNNLNYVYISANSNLTESTGITKYSWQTSDDVTTYNGKTYTNNPNLTTIYNNSGKAFDFQYSVNGTTGTAFVTGTIESYTTSSGEVFNSVTVTTGEPQE